MLRDLFFFRRRRPADEQKALSEEDVRRLQRVQRASASRVRVLDGRETR